MIEGSPNQRSLLIIPAFNEEESIPRVVGMVKEAGFDYVVVNDGSTDRTAEICRENAFLFIDLPVNLGLAGAFQAGVKYARLRDYDCVVQFDADGQHLTEYVPALVESTRKYDIVVGSRFKAEKKPLCLRTIGNSLLSTMVHVTTGKRLSDPTSGMRAYGRKAIEELSVGPNLGPEPDTLAYLIRKKKFSVSEVQVRMDERTAGESYLNLERSVSYMLRMAVSVLFVNFFR